MAKRVLPLILLVTLVGCSRDYMRAERAENVIVRSSKWGNSFGNSAIVWEYPDGSIKLLGTVCQPAVPVWAGGRFDVNYHWDTQYSCYQIDGVIRK